MCQTFINNKKKFLFIVMLFIICFATSSHGGTGYVVGGTPDTLHLNLYYTYDETDMDIFQNAFNEASRLMYNATNGQLQFGTIRVSKNATFANKADLRVLTGDDGAYASIGGLGTPGLNITIYRDQHRFTANNGPDFNERGQFGIVHELGHYAFILRDEYGNPATNYPDASCVYGYCAHPSTNTVACIMDGGTTVNNTRTEFCTDPADGLTQTSHVTSPLNHQEHIHGEACWETIADYCSTEYGITLTQPTTVDTTLPAGHIDPAWIVIGDHVRYVISIDKSYSMVGDKILNAKTGADLFVDLGHVNESEYIAVTSFSGGAGYDPAADVDYSLTEITGAADPLNPIKLAARTAINGILLENMTAIGDGLRVSLDELETLAEDDASIEAIIFLSDGVHNYGIEDPEDVIPDLKTRGVRVFTIGLGDPTDPIYPLDEDALQDIANETGGLYRHAPAPTDLSGIYTDYCAEVRGMDVCAEATEPYPYGEDPLTGIQVPYTETEEKAFIDDFTTEATFVLHWPYYENIFDLELILPDGNTVITPATAATNFNIDYVEMSNYEFYRIRNPMKGTWTLKIKYVTPNPAIVTEDNWPIWGLAHGLLQGIPLLEYTTQVLAKDRVVNFSGYLKNVRFTYPQVPIIKAYVVAGPPVAGALVTGIITRPDGSEVNIRLYDDGDFSHGDPIANDGDYSNRFFDFSVDGSYLISLTVENTEGVEANPDEIVPSGWTPQPISPFNRVFKNTVRILGLPEEFLTPVIGSISPYEGKQGETLNITITGVNFVENAIVSFIGDGIIVNGIDFINSEKLIVNITIDLDAALGARNIKIINPGGEYDIAERIFYVRQKVEPPQPIIGPKPKPCCPYGPSYYYSPPTYYFNYSPVKNIGIPFPAFSGTSSTQTTSFYNPLPTYSGLYGLYGGLYGLYGGLYGSFSPFSYSFMPLWGYYIPRYPSFSWSYSSSETSSVIGNSPDVLNYTFGSNYSGVNITITNY